MFCTNCGKALPERTDVCPYCGAEKQHIPGEEAEVESVNESDSVEWYSDYPELQEKSEESGGAQTWKDKLTDFVGKASAVFLLICLCVGAKNWIQSHYSQYKLYTTMYDSAVEEVEEFLSEASNLKIGDYDKDHVVLQKFDYYDFGYGRLRYAKYAVTVPVEWDTVYGHMDEDMTIQVFYYTCNQNCSDGVDASVPDHIHTQDISGVFDDWIEDLENVWNSDD
mgnify:CR=1 FL=1